MDELLLGKRLALNTSSERPSFIFINYFEPHDPYRPPPRYIESYLTSDQRRAYRKLQQHENRLAAHACGLPGIFDDQQIRLLKTLYDAEVAYRDEVIGGLLKILAEAGLTEDSWIAITSDHGELFGEQGMLYHTAGSHYRLLHIPLIVRPPGGLMDSGLRCRCSRSMCLSPWLEEAGVQIPDLAQRAYRLPLNGADPPRRALSVAQTHGASIAGLSITQRMNMQAELAHWLTWVDSVYIDGYLLEVNSRGLQALFNVREDPEMHVNLATVMAGRAESMANLFESWRERHADTRSGYETQTHMQVRDGGNDRLVVHTGPGG
ncbi:MAG: sulfatase-like hydrolase/transferase [Phycisphaerales bacterium]|nr:MAG: sulfatase-like hydrolase/transferase [Phycisphaerales bacterium]